VSTQAQKKIINKLMTCGMLSALATTTSSCMGDSKISTLKMYLSDEPGSLRYETICEKSTVSKKEFEDYYAASSNQKFENYSNEKFTKIEDVGSKTVFEVVHHTGSTKSEKVTASYVVYKFEGKDKPCVSWVNAGRVSANPKILSRNPRAQIISWLPVKLSDYYNYDFADRERQFMSVEIIDSDLLGFDYGAHIYIPYRGNELLHNYLLNATNPIIKVSASRGYSVSLNRNKVDELNLALKNLKRSADKLGLDFTPGYINYSQDNVTEDSQILYSPTALVVSMSDDPITALVR